MILRHATSGNERRQGKPQRSHRLQRFKFIIFFFARSFVQGVTLPQPFLASLFSHSLAAAYLVASAVLSCTLILLYTALPPSLSVCLWNTLRFYLSVFGGSGRRRDRQPLPLKALKQRLIAKPVESSRVERACNKRQVTIFQIYLRKVSRSLAPQKKEEEEEN